MAEFHDDFVQLVQEMQDRVDDAQAKEADKEASSGGAMHARGGGGGGADMNKLLETSAFTICVRIRPIIPHDNAGSGDRFAAVIPGLDTQLPLKTAFRGRTDRRVNRVVLLTPKSTTRGGPSLVKKVMKFDHVWGDRANDTDIYRGVGAGLVSKALEGRVGVCFAYGQTGSGKTHTMMGLMHSMAEALFRESSERNKVLITFSFFEILGTRCTDCLDSLVAKRTKFKTKAEESDSKRGVIIGEALSGAIVTRNLTEHTVRSADEFRRIVGIAAAHRSTRATERNATSSRSHAVATIKVHRTDFPEDARPDPGILRVIDLAGSERASDSKMHGAAAMKETKEINASLMSLKNCIRARTKASKVGASNDTQCHVPYRRNKLTLLMKDIFDIRCRRLCSTVVVATVSPLARDIAHSANTLGYAAPLRVAVGASMAKKNWETDPLDPSYWDHDATVAWVRTKGSELGLPAGLESKLCPGAIVGAQLIRMPESDFLARCLGRDQDSTDAVLRAKELYGDLWKLAVDAKTRQRRPDGSIVTSADLEAEAERTQAAMVAKGDLWRDRNAAMKRARAAEEASHVVGSAPTGPIQHMVEQRWSEDQPYRR